MTAETTKVCTVTLTQQDIDVLLALLEPSSQQPEDPGADLYTHLATAKRLARETFYLNIYEIKQNYGGPEEGGWYYHTTECVGIHPFAYLDEATRELEYIAADYNIELDSETIKQTWMEVNAGKALVDQSVAYYSESNKYGECTMLAIEMMPAASEDLERQHYE